MADMIKYKGQLYKRVDSISNAPKALRYKGQMFRRVDSEEMPHKLKELQSKMEHLDSSLKHVRVHTQWMPSANVLSVNLNIKMSNTRARIETIMNSPLVKHKDYLMRGGLWFTEKNGALKLDTSYLHGVSTLDELTKIAKEADKEIAEVEKSHKQSAKKVTSTQVKSELSKRLQRVKGFAGMYRFEFDEHSHSIEFFCDCKIPKNDEMDDDDRMTFLKPFSRAVEAALHGFAKVKFDINMFTRGDNGTKNTEPVPYSGTLEKAWVDKNGK